jgi:hypothetical protein
MKFLLNQVRYLFFASQIVFMCVEFEVLTAVVVQSSVFVCSSLEAFRRCGRA